MTAAEKAYNALTEDQLTFLSDDEHAKMRARMQTLIEGEALIKAADMKKLEAAQDAYEKVKNSEDGLTIDPTLAAKFETSKTAYYAYEQQAEDFREEHLTKLPEDSAAVSVSYKDAIPAARTAS